MNTRWIPALAVLTALQVGPSLGAQSPASPQAAGGESGTPAASSPEDLVLARAIPYRPAITRDPFSSPTEIEGPNKGDMVDDIAIKGVMKMNGKILAVVSDSRGNVRWLPVGYKFKDGEIVAIDEKAVTFRQWDPNSNVRTAVRTVVKTFKREEGKR